MSGVGNRRRDGEQFQSKKKEGKRLRKRKASRRIQRRSSEILGGH